MADSFSLPRVEAPLDPLSALHELRAPQLDGLSSLADGAMALAAGLLAALLLSWLFEIATRRAESRVEGLGAALTASRSKPPADRLAAQARVLQAIAQRMNPEADADWREALAPALKHRPADADTLAALAVALYQPGPTPDLDATEALIRSLLRRQRWIGVRAR
ncbi:MAG: hypothetical protein KTR21_03850 [Rhodobacteraceae bacterium]|nr:hypothetical protein [Paracoccaceae bacterium]